jgi:nitroreductase
MNQALDFILTRRSIRKFANRPVADELVTQLLRAAMAAPSAGNQQPWHFVVMTDRTVLDAVPAFHPHAAMIREAPLAIAVCGDLSLEKHQGMWTLDCSAATQNLLLAVNALGLGAVWLGIYPRAERMAGMKELLGLPETVIPFSLVPIGYPNEHKPPADRYQESRVRRNRW